MATSTTPKYTVPGISTHDGGRIIDVLGKRLHTTFR